MITITITRNEKGQIMLNGPIQDKVFMLGMLETAKFLVQDWHKEHHSNIVAPPPGLKLEGM